MKSAERKWLALLAAVAGMALTAVNASLVIEDKSAAGNSRQRLSAELKKERMNARERDSIQAEVERLKGENAAAAKADALPTDPVALGSQAKLEFARKGLEVKSYSVAQGKRASAIEFELEGNPAGISSFLAAEGSGTTAFSVSRCSIAKADTAGRLRAGIGISAKRIYLAPSSAGDEEKAAALIASIAYRQGAMRPAASATPQPSPSATPRLERVQWIGFIGKTVLTDGTTQYFLKDNQKGRMLELRMGQSGDAVVSETDDSVTIRYQGVLYEIRKK
jgi:hypothetical protein